METELRQLPIGTREDVNLVYETALQLARLSGLQLMEQVGFAAAVAEMAINNLGADTYLHYSVDRRGQKSFWLKAAISGKQISIEKEIPSIPDLPQLTVQRNFFWKSRKQLEESCIDMQQFTFAISHDLKNSLTKLKLALALVEDEELPPAILPYMQIIHRSAVRLERTMLGLNQIIEQGHSSASIIKKILPAEIFEDVYDEFAETLEKIGAVVKADLNTTGEISYVEVYLKSILTNLTSNAIKYRSAERTLQVNVTMQRISQDELILLFEDNGKGIDTEIYGHKLFLPFTRFSADTEGSGIGLYLIKTMVERNGGKAELSSRPGQGSSFCFTIREYK